MIMLAPSTCQLDQVVYGRDAHQMARFRLIRNEILGPGGVYYVGDFRMSSTSEITDRNFFYTTWTSTWHTDNMRDNYEATTTAMKAQFPQFASVHTENRVTH